MLLFNNNIMDNVLKYEYLRKIPYDLIINNILPYSYETKSNELLSDIRSFVSDYSLLISVYSYDLNFDILIYDIICFYNRSRLPSYNINNWFRYALKRSFKLKKYTVERMNKFIFNSFYTNIVDDRIRKIRFLWALLTPSERAEFINEYILDTT